MTMFLGAALCALGGCAGLGGHDPGWARASEALVWPNPPATPRVRFLRSVQTSEDLAGDDRSGRALSWLTGESGAEVQIGTPFGVAADGQGKVWLADTEQRVVQVIDLARRRTAAWRNLGRWELLSPVGVAYDVQRQRLYVSDSGLRKVFVVEGEPAHAVVLQPPGGFLRPTGLAVAPDGTVYVTDTLARVIKVFAADGSFLGERRSGLTPDGLFSLPGSLAVDDLGRLFVVDAMNFRVEFFSPAGDSLGSLGQLGDVPGSFARPRGIAVDADHHVYVSDAAFDNIQVFDLAGRLLLSLGGPGNAPGKFNLPAGMTFDAMGRLYVVDSFNHRVQLFEYLSH